ncbi:MAG: LD-carboxypeptidase [Acidobacteria bacterium]|nr:LD-carboxypeptidase [Acidobacteriota bacterium]
MSGTWKKPGRLLPGDRIGVIAPASAFDREEFEKGVLSLRNMGFEPVYDDSLFSQHLYFAGMDAQRADCLARYLKDDTTHAVICVRGGYGSTRLLPYLSQMDWSKPKIFMGSSDVTALLCFFSSEQGWVTFHGPMLAGDIARGRVNAAQWTTCLGGGQFPAQIRDQVVCWKPGRAQGILYGGCLSILCGLLGTKTRWQMDGASDLVLFLEDIGCKSYQIDRMLTQLVQSGFMDRVRGLILGEMVDCESAGVDLRSVVLDALASFRFPICAGFPSGHTTRESLVLPFGIPVDLDGEENVLTFLESPVA